MQESIMFTVVFVVFFSKGTFCQSINLTPAQAIIDINSTFTFTCIYAGYGEVQATLWDIGKRYSPSIVRSQDGTCTGGGIFSNDAFYKVGCPSKTSFTVTILGVKLEDHNVTWNCLDFNRKSNTVTVLVKVPVTKVILSEVAESSSFMKEHSSQIIKCTTSYSRPQPRVSWYIQHFNSSFRVNVSGNSSTKSLSSHSGLYAVESTLRLYPNRTINNWMLFCEGWIDGMTRTVQSNILTLNVTYPPDSPPSILGFEGGETYKLIESEVGQLSCSTFGGNPLPRLVWKCYNKKPTVEKIAATFVMSNVTWIALRDQTSCSCISNHSWTETTQSKVLQIDVQFQTEIKRFSLSSMNIEEAVAINETYNATFVCIAEANPSSNLTINNPNGENTFEISNSNVAIYTLHNASYLNAGEYTCIGRNNYTKSSPARSSLTLIVRCPPRPSSGDRSVVKVTVLIYKDEILTFTAMKYLDEPTKTVFKWLKENKLIFDNGIKYTIRSDDSQSNLSIRNISKQDLGTYSVSARNSVGEYIHYYELNAAGKPEPPKDFRIIDNLMTDSSVTLTWSSGFNGGLQQTFVIVYKMKLENAWINESVIDNGKEIMFYAIYDLSSMQEYDIQMYAQNTEGKSATSQRLRFKTKASKRKLEETLCSTNTGVFVGIGAGTFLSAFVIFTLLLIAYKQFRKLKKSRLKRHQKGNLDEHQFTVIEESQASSAYSDLDGNKKEVNVYDDLNVHNMSTSPEHHDSTSPETAEMRNARGTSREKIEYINIKI